MAYRKSYTGFPTSHQQRFYAALNFLNMGIKYLNLSSFIQVSTIKDEKSAAKFHYIIAVSSKVVAQLIAFRVVSIFWQGGDPLPLKSRLKLTHPWRQRVLTHFALYSASTVRDRKRSSIMANRKFYTGVPASHQRRFYAAPNFLKMGINYLNLSSFGQFRQYRTKSLLQSFTI